MSTEGTTTYVYYDLSNVENNANDQLPHLLAAIHPIIKLIYTFIDPLKFAPANPLVTCAQCKKKSEDAKICSRCRIVRYCGKECQAKDHPKHKKVCSYIKGFRARAEDELKESRVKRKVPIFSPPNSCESAMSYLRRYELALAIVMKAPETGDDFAFEVALDHFFNLLNNRNIEESDKEYPKNIIFFLMMTLGHRQRAYDLLKFWIWQRYSTMPYRNETHQKDEIVLDNDVTEDILVSDGLIEEYGAGELDLAALVLLKLSIISDLKFGDVMIPHTKLEGKIKSVLERAEIEGEYQIDIYVRECRVEQERLVKYYCNHMGKDFLFMHYLSNLEEIKKNIPLQFPNQGENKSRIARFLLEISLEAFKKTDGALEYVQSLVGNCEIGKLDN